MESTPQREQLPWQLIGLRRGFRLLDMVAPSLAGAAALRLFLSPRRRPRPINPAIVATATPLHFLHNGQRLNGFQWGNGERAILLVHGWETDASHLGAFVEPLVAAGFRVVAFDAPAHGSSHGRTTDVLSYSSAINAIVERYGPFYGLVAHSLGGAASLWMAGHREQNPFERAVLIASAAQLADTVDGFARLLALPERTLRHLGDAFRRRYGLHPADVSIGSRARDFTIPGLLIHDRGDRQISFAHSEAIHAAWPTSTLVATEGLGHNRILRDAQVIGRTVAFLREQ